MRHHLKKHRPIIALAILTGLAAAIFGCSASAADPKVPPAQVPSGRLIAVLMTGLDYTRPDIARRLARDGEGELIGWDVVDNDRTPYAASPSPTPAQHGGDGTGLALELLALPAATEPEVLVPIRIDPADPVSLAKGLAALIRMPVRTVLIPMWSQTEADWSVLRAAAAHLPPETRIAVPACAALTPAYPRDLKLPNMVFDPSASDPFEAFIARRPCDAKP